MKYLNGLHQNKMMFKLLKHMVEVLEKEKMFYIMMIVILNKLWKMNNKII